MLRYVCRASGSAAPAADYVRNTVAHLVDIGIGEPRLEFIARQRPRSLSAPTPT